MSKALEMVRTMINGANEYEKKTGDKNPPVYFSKDNLLIIEQSLQRLEEIDNANPSEALRNLECLKSHISARDMLGETNKKIALDICNNIEKALLKAQEPKQYIKWEDLEFNIEKQMMKVLLNGTKYTLIVGCNVHFDKLAFLRNGEINYYFLEADKQFFNDLHLERVE